MPDAVSALREHLAVVQDLERAARVLQWDQETYMPEEATTARAQQLATLKRLAHERFTDDQTGDLLEALKRQLEKMSPHEPEHGFAAPLHRVTARDYRRARCLPAALVSDFSQAVALAKRAWRQARAADDFDIFAPHLTQLVDLSRQKAEAFGYEEAPYDALLEIYEPGLTSATLARIFGTVRGRLVPLVEKIAEACPPDTSFLNTHFDETDQWEFGLAIARDFGYDLSRGRQDHSAHPFTTSFSTSDVRITTHIDPTDFIPGFFATLHEAGHALYEQGFDPELDRTPLADGASLGIHESQARLWENLVGRSRPFWSCYFPGLQDRFEKEFGHASLDEFYRAINRVAPSLIRVRADEVTYNLHIMLRFELEQNLIEGSLAVEDLPAAWNDRMGAYLGIQPEGFSDGVLQDIHWSLGAFGYFPTYALGNLMSVQIYQAAQESIPKLQEQVRSGQFGDLLGWLRRCVHAHGRKMDAPDLLRDITGEGLEAGPWLAYIDEKYSELYDL